MNQIDAEVEEPNSLLADTIDRLLAATCTFEAVEEAETDRWAPKIWDPLAEAGFPWVGVPEADGGSGGSLIDAAAVLRAIGMHSAPVPVAESGVLGGWMLAASGLALPHGPIAVIADGLTIIGGRIRSDTSAAWAERASRIVGIVFDAGVVHVVSFTPEQITVTQGANLAGEPRDGVAIDVAVADVDVAIAPVGVSAQTLLIRGAWSRVLLTAGALAALSSLVVDYTHTRRQFGKPIASFQAVQQHIVVVAQCAARASIAADAATRAIASGDGALEVAAARVVCDEAAHIASRAAHQAHGAMGVTREYPLHHVTRRLWSWPHEYGTTRYWTRELGRLAHRNGADGLFPLIAD